MLTSDYELIVVNDGLDDRTPELLRRFSSRIRVSQKSNGGQASVFNFGIPECGSEVIAFLETLLIRVEREGINGSQGGERRAPAGPC